MTENKDQISRRSFVTAGALASAGAALAIGSGAGRQSPADTAQPQDMLPLGKIGDMEVSRLIFGGNLLEQAMHSRDLRYVCQLARHYNTTERAIETLKLAESLGINTMSGSIKETSMKPLREYREKHNGKMQWIICPFAPLEDGLAKFNEEVEKLMDWGCDAIYIWGVRGDQYARAGRIDLIGKAVEAVKAYGVPCGVGGHLLEVVAECERQKVPADFYIKTLHHHDYPSAKLDYDSLWCKRPNELIEFMQSVRKPWIAFKVMAAGAIPPENAFPFAFNGGADFVLAGMFDFQVAHDVKLASGAVAGAKRKRPWRA